MQLTSTLVNYKGTISAIVDTSSIKEYISKFNIPNHLLEYQQTRDNNTFHLTVINPYEYKQSIDLPLDSFTIYILGLGFSNECYYLICYSPFCDSFRKRLNLPTKDFHVTIAFNKKDVHDINKSLSTVMNRDEFVKMNSTYLTIPSSFTDSVNLCKLLQATILLFSEDDKHLYSHFKLILKTYINELCKIGRINEAIEVIEDYNTRYLGCITGIYMKLRIFKQVNLLTHSIISDIHAIITSAQLIEKDIKLYKECINIINDYIVSNCILDSLPLLYIDENRIKVVTEVPRNFSLINYNKDGNNKLYGSAIIKEKHEPFLKALNIDIIVNLIQEIEPPKIRCSEMCYIPIQDYRACDIPTLNKAVEVLSTTKKNIIVHCVGGLGRTNMILSAYLMKTNNISMSEALTFLINNRNVHLSGEQILLLKEYYLYLYSSNNSNSSTNDINTGIYLVIGIPCSGKSTFCETIVNKCNSKEVLHLNQDELGKTDIMNIFCKQQNNYKCILLDRCNFSVEDRKQWISMSKKPIYAIYFDIPLNVCLERLKSRKNHPTLNSNSSRVLQEMQSSLEQPSMKEGFKSITVIRNEEDIENFMNTFFENKDTKLYKFPRTHHILNLGSATRDDLLLSKKDIEYLLSEEVIAQEKIDGANLGFSLVDNKIVAQNRSHYVNSAYHPQFKKLDNYIEKHSSELYEIFEKGDYILFGEWMAMKHSIHYKYLSDVFILFDIFDKQTQTFLTNDKMKEIIKNTTIKTVPILYKGKLSLTELKNMINNKSQFYDGQIEGVYVRKEDEKSVVARGKIVRSDFLTSDTHWTKGGHVLNEIKDY
jgi:predicted kinase